MLSDNVIVSLCYVSSQNDYTTQLCRIADYHNGKFEQYVYDSTYDFYETERDILYGSSRDISGSVGSVSVYAWSAYLDSNTNEWRTSIRESDIPWVEVIGSSLDTVEQLIDKLKCGIKLSMSPTRKHDIILCCNIRKPFVDAIYVSADDLMYANGLYTISDDVTSVEVSNINYYEDTSSCRCRYNRSDTIRYLAHPDQWKVTGRISLRSHQEIVSSVVSTYIRRLNKDGVISRKERQNFMSVIDKLSATDISDEVMAKLACTHDEAITYVREYLADQTNRLERNEADWVMRQLIENDSEYAQEMTKAVEAKWHEANAAMRDEWAAEYQKAQDTLASIQQEIRMAQSELEASRKEREQCDATVAQALQLQEDIEKNIQEKLASIRSDRAKALVDEAWAMAASSTSICDQKPTNALLLDDEESNDSIEEVSLEERWTDAVVQWECICANDARSIELSAFFLAAYANRQNLLVTGECAELIADVASKIATGRSCLKVYVTGRDNLADIIQAIDLVPHDCICFINGLEQNDHALKIIMRHFNNSQFFITASHYESLVMEPASLFTTFLPVCSEEFCIVAAPIEINSYSCKSDLRSEKYTNHHGHQLRSIRVSQSPWFANGFFAPMLVDRCAHLHYVIKAILTMSLPDGEEITKRTMLSMVYVPLMRCLRRKDILVSNLSEFEILDDTRKTRLLAFSGIEKE